jgi:hemerythrin
MSLIEWREEFAIGIPEVDYEHQRLIELINAVHADLGTERSLERIDEFLGEIYARISAHFALEEKVMRARDYDQLADHKADHERLLDELREIMDDVQDRGALDESVLAEQLSRWFGDHFRSRDARLHHALAR